MAGRGPAPKSPDQRRNRVAPGRGEWVELPREGRKGKAPALPSIDGLVWLKSTRDWWARIWSTPEATQWDERDDELVRLAVLRQQFMVKPVAAISAEMRQIEDRHGMNEKGRRDLRWRLAAETKPAASPSSGRGKGKAANVVVVDRWQGSGV